MPSFAPVPGVCQLNSDVSKRDIAVTALLLVLVVAGGLGAFAVVVATFWDDESSVVVDQAVVVEWEHAVAPGLGDLNSLDDPPGLTAEGRARVNPCSTDDGELFDLEPGLAWIADVPGEDLSQVSPETADGVHSIVRQLVAKGWVIDERRSIMRMDLPPGLGFDTIGMHRRANGIDLELSMQVYSSGPFASLYYSQGRPACHLAT